MNICTPKYLYEKVIIMFNEENTLWVENFLDKCEKKIFSVMDEISIDYPMDIRGNTSKCQRTISWRE